MHEEVGVGPGLGVEGGVSSSDALGYVVVEALGLVGDPQGGQVVHHLEGVSAVWKQEKVRTWERVSYHCHEGHLWLGEDIHKLDQLSLASISTQCGALQGGDLNHQRSSNTSGTSNTDMTIPPKKLHGLSHHADAKFV